MDLQSLSMAFATIVGLLCNFKQEARAGNEITREEFLKWLEEHRHEQVKALILANKQLATEIDSFLSQEHEQILSELTAINEALGSIATHMRGLQGLAHSLYPQSTISDQAVSILRQLVESTSERFDKLVTRAGVSLGLVNGGHIVYTEPRFLDDDIETLVKYGLLRVDYGSKGDIFYCITRNAVSFVTAGSGEGSSKKK